MNLNFVKSGLMAAKQISPTGLMIGGVVGAVGATVLACRATLKLRPVLEETAEKLEEVELEKELINTAGDRLVSDSQIARAKVKVVSVSCLKVARLYAPAAAVMTVSIAAISGGHVIMIKRNATLAAALTLTEQSFNKYRKAVAEKIGEDEERALRAGVTVEDVHDTKKGEVTKAISADPSKHSQYARFFDESNVNWERNANYNLMFLRAQQEYANNKLQAQGWLLLNDVYDALGFDKTSTGAVVGWVISKEGDNYIDFGIYDYASPKARQFVNGDERSILLDFNVDGVVWHLIGEEKKN